MDQKTGSSPRAETRQIGPLCSAIASSRGANASGVHTAVRRIEELIAAPDAWDLERLSGALEALAPRLDAETLGRDRDRLIATLMAKHRFSSVMRPDEVFDGFIATLKLLSERMPDANSTIRAISPRIMSSGPDDLLAISRALVTLAPKIQRPTVEDLADAIAQSALLHAPELHDERGMASLAKSVGLLAGYGAKETVDQVAEILGKRALDVVKGASGEQVGLLSLALGAFPRTAGGAGVDAAAAAVAKRTLELIPAADPYRAKRPRRKVNLELTPYIDPPVFEHRFGLSLESVASRLPTRAADETVKSLMTRVSTDDFDELPYFARAIRALTPRLSPDVAVAATRKMVDLIAAVDPATNDQDDRMLLETLRSEFAEQSKSLEIRALGDLLKDPFCTGPLLTRISHQGNGIGLPSVS